MMAQGEHGELWNQRNEDFFRSQYPLHRVCRDGDLETLSLLMENSGELNFYEEDGLYGWTPTHWAAYFGKLACLMRLLQHGISCDFPVERFHQTPAHLAASSNRCHCLKWLLHCGALINRQDYMGETPVHKAARAGSMECINLLISQGANLSSKNYHGWTPAQLAFESDHKECGHVLKSALDHQLQKGDLTSSSSSPDLSVYPVSIPAPDHPLNNDIEGINGGLIPMPHRTESSDQLSSSNQASHLHPGDIGKDNQNLCDMETCDSDEFVEDAATRFGLPGIVTVGRKRCLENLEESSMKKTRYGEPVIRDMYSGLPLKVSSINTNFTNGNLITHHITTSAVEHCSSLTMEQGYENMYINTIS